jgi:predicted acylesterase/phospholipase RssA
MNSCSIQNSNKYSFAFSGSGWLLPFHLGVIRELRTRKLLNCHTDVSGTSGGSIAALVSASNLDPDFLLERLICISERIGKGDQSHLAGTGNTLCAVSLDSLLRKEIAGLLSMPTLSLATESLIERLNKAGNLRICVTAITKGENGALGLRLHVINKYGCESALVDSHPLVSFRPCFAGRSPFISACSAAR